ncbi:MAG TPA: TraR/DksA family transcriptional regulator, partial [Gemmatales bacterium]|nr:TraR/DksA family transcriptional regulator [Gemmatales bacterium]
DALLKLHQRLVERRNSLRAILTRDLADLNIGDNTGDEVDAAFDSGAEEINSSLAEIESRELHLIEKAIAKLKNATYGICEHCQKKIPVARLNALPYSVYCMPCQREMERNPGNFQSTNRANWEAVYDNARRYSDEPSKFDLAALEHD